MTDRPIITGVFIVCTLVGAAAGAIWLPAEWEAARRIAAGAVSGAGCALLFTATRIVG